MGGMFATHLHVLVAAAAIVCKRLPPAGQKPSLWHAACADLRSLLTCFAGDRHQLWEEKVGLVQPFAGNAATEWGTAAEPKALATYQAVTGQRIDSCMFQGAVVGGLCGMVGRLLAGHACFYMPLLCHA